MEHTCGCYTVMEKHRIVLWKRSAARWADLSVYSKIIRKNLLMITGILCLLCLCGCQFLPEAKYLGANEEVQDEYQIQGEPAKESEKTEEENSVAVALPPDQIRKDKLKIGDSWEATKDTDSAILKGTLIYTIIGASTATNIHEVSMTERSFLPYDSEIIWYEDNQERILAYPECIQEDGTLLHGAKLVLVDIKVENIDAESAHAERKGYDLDLFRADSILQFCDYGDKSVNPEEGERLYYPFFFDQASTDYPEQMNPFFYKIPPGETRIITVGTLVCERCDGTKVKLSDLGVVIKQTAKHLYFDLGLSDE